MQEPHLITQNSSYVITGNHTLHTEVAGGKVITNFHARGSKNKYLGSKNKYLGLFKFFLL